LSLLANAALSRPLHLDTIQGKYREQFASARRNNLTVGEFNDHEKLRAAMQTHWNEQQGYPRVKSFNEMLK
jgi:hypothetical protein